MNLVTRLIKKAERSLSYTSCLRKLRKERLEFDGINYVDYSWIKLIFTDDGDAQEIYYHQNCLKYYANEMPIFLKYIKKEDTVVDVGANMGFTTTMFSSIVGERGKVFCFEPSKYIYEKLIKTIKLNNLSQAIPFNFGCGEQSCKLKLNKVNNSSGNSSLLKESSTSNTEIVEIVPLDNVEKLNKYGINFLKIDTEGFEPYVLLGAEKLIKTYRPFIYIEMGGDYIESTHKTLEILERFNYKTNLYNNINWSLIGNGYNVIATPN
ncbi:FkbM family methyltransferase [Pelatocladus sp. BLCC-F211]|uniref:FkbM family methyltransferase n=1 Tax=Pelatocladus sp. BLCC-F211 TaxID=3342752 RepID=UPI0035B98376